MYILTLKDIENIVGKLTDQFQIKQLHETYI